ncbi:glycosyltransferase [Pantanalinema sp. GBBB05]|uniref:glycosyltransferase n=1 Tax=Pantanalinema sp. GBBB05 TaxID=2604139 RepID=UPI001D255E37|nr:glycosyltransferase family 1 protein [Pantanalinema sp. GBBB05]
MASIVITTAGTLGDYLPYIELGKALKQQGHDVRCAVGESMFPYVEKANLQPVKCSYSLNQTIAHQNAQDWNELSGLNRFKQPSSEPASQRLQEKLLRQELEQVLEDLIPICETADLLICGYQRTQAGQFIAEKLKLPWVSTSVMPYALEFLPPSTTAEFFDPNLPIINQIRQTFSLPILSQSEWLNYNHQQNSRAILVASPHFCILNPYYQNYQQVGFWFYQELDWATWQPDPELQNFMASEPKPLVLTFSSLPLQDARTVLNLHIRAAIQLGYKLLVQQGWADFNEDLISEDSDRTSVLFRGFMPQDWLFSHASAVIHHGGIGTIARAIRNDCPMVVEPYGNDQFFNAKQILRLKIGAVMHPQRMTAEGLASVLQHKVLNDQCRQNVQNLGEKIREEDGLAAACDLITSWL